jgi:pilus assembly protein CpaE
MSDQEQPPQTAKTVTCAVARNLEDFELLIDDLEREFGEAWGGLEFSDVAGILNSAHAKDLHTAVIAINRQDETDLEAIENTVKEAKKIGLNVIIVTDDLGPTALHRLIRGGADDFLPYPLPPNALHETLERLTQAKDQSAGKTSGSAPTEETPPPAPKVGRRQGIIFPVYGLSGGVGASTFAVNLAWELQKNVENDEKTVCILDFDFQFGSVSTYLDVPKSEASYELLTNAANVDSDALLQAMHKFDRTLDVLSAPQDSLPLEFISPEEIAKIIDVASKNYDFIIIDLPTAIVSWTEVVLEKCQLFFGVLEMDMRSAQNTLRFMRALKADEMPYEKVQFILNRAPKTTDLGGKSRVKRMADSLDVDFRWFLPDGGKQILNACDHGSPLASVAKKNPMRREIHRISATLSELAREEV